MSKLILMLSILIGGINASADISIEGFKLGHCVPSNLCLEIKSKSAVRSDFAPIWVAKSSQVKLIDKETNLVVQEWTDKMVIVDEFANQVLLRDIGGAKEWQLNLDTLRVKEY